MIIQKFLIRRRIIWPQGLIISAVLAVSPFLAHAASDASFFLSPSSKSLSPGQTFTVAIKVSSPEQAMNAASGVLSFPPDKLEVVSLSKSGSIFSLWTQDPTFSNSIGSVNFEGIVLNPGFTGTNGLALTVTFKVKAGGTAPVDFSSGQILANDGKGTNILTGMSGAKFTLAGAAASPVAAPPSPQPKAPVKTPAGPPAAPQVASLTNPDPNSWHNDPNPKFTWQMSADVTAVRTLYDDSPNSQPNIVYSPPIGGKDLTNVPDGVWYFHIQFRNAKGWGQAAHFRFQVDTQPPEPFRIRIIDGLQTTNPRPTILFDTVDSLSGISEYQLKIGESDFNTLDAAQVPSNPYTLPPQPAGTRTILVKAVDRAGNYATATSQVTIESQQAPTITYFTRELTAQQDFVIRGITSPNSELIIWMLPEGGQPIWHIISSDASGNFSFIHPGKLSNNAYLFWVVTRDSAGARSDPTPKYSFVVGPNKFMRIITAFWKNSDVFILLAVSSAVLLIVLLYIWRRYLKLKRSLRREIASAQTGFRQAFNLLRSDLAGYIDLLEKAKTKRALTQTENNVKRQLKQNLDGMQAFMGDELQDMEKDIK